MTRERERGGGARTQLAPQTLAASVASAYYALRWLRSRWPYECTAWPGVRTTARRRARLRRAFIKLADT